ncbi:MAG TPA: SDR family oxidoreductase [Gammaproteobacteria bacterium]|nr:SDR family oxidoreductase [Gammaproteobacteria bacterium]
MREVWDNPKNAEMLKKFLNKVPLGRFMEPSELVPLVLFLASSGSNYMNGAMLQIDDGARFNPD